MIEYKTIILSKGDECLLVARSGCSQVFVNGILIGNFHQHTDGKEWITMFNEFGDVALRVFISEGIFRSAEDFSYLIK